MRFGFCSEITNAPALQKAGYDYIEYSVKNMVQLPEETFREHASMLRTLDFYAETFNCFYSDQIVVGEEVTPADTLRAYTERAMDRVARLGGKVVVYGSSKARNIPEGFSKERAYEQFCQAVYMTGEAAAPYGIIVVLEPLNIKETNFFHKVEEGLQIVRDVNHPNVQLLADMYHVCQMQEDFRSIIEAGNHLRHVHIAEPEKRTPPSFEDTFEYASFAEALRQAGYDERISVEANMPEGEPLESVAARVLPVLKKYF